MCLSVADSPLRFPVLWCRRVAAVSTPDSICWQRLAKLEPRLGEALWDRDAYSSGRRVLRAVFETMAARL